MKFAETINQLSLELSKMGKEKPAKKKKKTGKVGEEDPVTEEVQLKTEKDEAGKYWKFNPRTSIWAVAQEGGQETVTPIRKSENSGGTKKHYEQKKAESDPPSSNLSQLFKGEGGRKTHVNDSSDEDFMFKPVVQQQKKNKKQNKQKGQVLSLEEFHRCLAKASHFLFCINLYCP